MISVRIRLISVRIRLISLGVALARLVPVLALGSPTQATQDQVGTWFVYGSGTGTGSVCIHAALMPDSKLLCIERPHTSPYPVLNPNTDGETSTLVDLANPNNPPLLTGLVYNAFCAGHAQAADGSIFVAGGDAQDSNKTDGTTFMFDGRTKLRFYSEKGSNDGVHVGSWNESSSMTTQRWYPTVVTLGDGSFIIVSGDTRNLDFDNLLETDKNPTFEYFPPRHTNAPWLSPLLDWAFPHNLYPIMFQLPGGGVFLLVSNRSIIIDTTKDPGTDPVGYYKSLPDMPAVDHAPWIYPHTPTAFILPMKESDNYTATIMICGGSQLSSKLASTMCYAITPEDPNPQWVQKADMPNARMMPDSALLPDGTILLTNGAGYGQAGGNAGQCQYAAAPVFATDLYNPAKDTWTSGIGTMSTPRLYHSGVLLLEDASVVTVGSEMYNYLDCWGSPTSMNLPSPLNAQDANCWPNENGKECTDPYTYTIEKFAPSYLKGGPATRPKITNPASSLLSLTYGSTLTLTLDPSKSALAASVALIRYSTTTHSTNTDQRLLLPTVIFVNKTMVIVRLPPNGNIAPPGNYHCFVVSDTGVPSEAARIKLGPGTPVTDLPPGITTLPTSTSTTTKGGTGSMSQSSWNYAVAFGVIVVVVAGAL